MPPDYCHIAPVLNLLRLHSIGRGVLPRVLEPSDQLLDLIYDAATEQELWRTVMTEIADLTGSQGGVLFGQSFGASKVYFDYNGRLSEECNRAYKERHFQNPWNKAMSTQPVGRVVLSDDVVPLCPSDALCSQTTSFRYRLCAGRFSSMKCCARKTSPTMR
jgi:hypothetical protein